MIYGEKERERESPVHTHTHTHTHTRKPHTERDVMTTVRIKHMRQRIIVSLTRDMSSKQLCSLSLSEVCIPERRKDLQWMESAHALVPCRSLLC